jgi:hypothetical protein
MKLVRASVLPLSCLLSALLAHSVGCTGEQDLGGRDGGETADAELDSYCASFAGTYSGTWEFEGGDCAQPPGPPASTTFIVSDSSTFMSITGNGGNCTLRKNTASTQGCGFESTRGVCDHIKAIGAKSYADESFVQFGPSTLRIGGLQVATASCVARYGYFGKK